MDFKEINDHLNKKQYEMNQSDKKFTTPKSMIKSSSEPAIKQLNGFEKYLDNKIANKGSEVKVFGNKQNYLTDNNMPTLSSDEISLNEPSTHRVEKVFLTETKLNN